MADEEFFECANPMCDAPPPNALTIGGADSSGAAGVHGDLQAFNLVKVHATSILTAVTAQTPTKVAGIFPVDPEMVSHQMEAVFDELTVQAGKIGMLHSADNVRAIADLWPADIPLVLDPVLIATSGDALAEDDLIESIIHELPGKVTLATPNIPEAMTLLGKTGDPPNPDRLLVKLHDIFQCPILLKGGHQDDTFVTDRLFIQGEVLKFKRKRFDRVFRGTGCTLSALITGMLAHGWSVENATIEAESLLGPMLTWSYPLGDKVYALDTQQGVYLGSEEAEEAIILRKAIREFLQLVPSPWIPEVGSNFGYGKKEVRDLFDVVALTGRIVGKQTNLISGELQWGGSLHVARIIKAATAVYPKLRSAVNLRYRKDILEAISDLEGKGILRSATFDRADQPRNADSSMEWGTHTALQNGRVDIIIDGGAKGKEPMIRVLGKHPLDVLRKVRLMVDIETGMLE